MYASMNEEIEARHIVVRALERMEKDDPQGVSYIRRHLLALDEQLASTLKAAQGGVTEAMVDTAVEAFDDLYDGVSHNKREAIRHALEAALSAEPADSKVIGDDLKVKPAERVPEGMVLVPREPTDEMLRATHAPTHDQHRKHLHNEARRVWAAMIAATPAAPAEEGDGKEGVR